MTILFFAQAAQLMGRRKIQIELPRPAALRDILLRPELSPLIGMSPSTRYAVNEEFAELDRPVGASDIVAVLPPVSGG